MTDGPFGRRPGSEPPAPDEPPLPPPKPPPPPRTTSRVTWILGVALVLALGYITLNTIRTDAPGSRGIPDGDPLPPFAAPLATSDVEADANIAEKAGAGAEGGRAACTVRGPEILNVCELYERGPVVLAFVATRSDRCEEQVDVLDRVRPRFPDVAFAAVAVRGSHDDVRKVVRERRWELPVGWDRDGAVANTYAVAVCPTITFARRGGEVARTALEFLDERELAAAVEDLR